MVDDADRAQLLSRLERMQLLIDELERTQTDAARERLRERLKREMDAARHAVKVIGTHDSI